MTTPTNPTPNNPSRNQAMSNLLRQARQDLVSQRGQSAINRVESQREAVRRLIEERKLNMPTLYDREREKREAAERLQELRNQIIGLHLDVGTAIEVAVGITGLASHGCLFGGAVRDILTGHEPHDYDYQFRLAQPAPLMLEKLLPADSIRHFGRTVYMMVGAHTQHIATLRDLPNIDKPIDIVINTMLRHRHAGDWQANTLCSLTSLDQLKIDPIQQYVGALPRTYWGLQKALLRGRRLETEYGLELATDDVNTIERLLESARKSRVKIVKSTEVLTGVRAFKPGQGFQGVVHSVPWREAPNFPGAFQAECNQGLLKQHLRTGEEHNCGFWSFKSFQEMMRQEYFTPQKQAEDGAIGIVHPFGIVRDTENCYISEYMEVETVIFWGDSNRIYEDQARSPQTEFIKVDGWFEAMALLIQHGIK